MIENLLKLGVDNRASDIHLGKDVPPIFRINGKLIYTDFQNLTEKDTERFAITLSTDEQWTRFLKHGELDFAYTLPGSSNRYRINIYRNLGSVRLAIRVLPKRIPTIDQLGLPEVIKKLTRLLRGLVLVTGQTGSGKTTTLAAMVDLINNERACHILTLEDPVEYIHKNKESFVSQREIYTDSCSFFTGLRAALREDPDVILVGEMRDNETIAAAITAAETGHLVLATLHTGDAAQTINRIIDGFPANQQPQIRMQLSMTLQGIISQQLLPKSDGTGRTAALEILTATPAIKNLIREGRNHQIMAEIHGGSRFGMISMEASLNDLYQKGIINKDDALLRVTDQDIFNMLQK